MEALLQVPLFLLLLVGGTLLLFFVITAPARRQQSDQRRRGQQANAMIAQAESKLLLGDVAAAESLYLRALPLADGVDPLLFAEAYYGVARCAERRGDYEYAAQSVRFALAYVAEWRHEKPAYEQLLNRELQRLEALARPKGSI